MKKTKITSIIVIAVALALHVVGLVLIGAEANMSNFNIVPLAQSLRDIGFMTALLSALVLITTVIIDLAKSAFEKDGK
ncbi:MAG: hypothetical protein FWC80_06910 [Firmicutes bacterium]|nr:hypothetical protein [Bacillota bacterium]